LSNRKSGYELHHHSYVSFLSHFPRTNTRSGEILCFPFLFLSFHFGFPLFGSVGHVERPIWFHVPFMGSAVGYLVYYLGNVY
jgi:hypothetical protein